MAKVYREKRWNVLSKLIRDNGYRTMVEIGVKSGQNILSIIRRCPHTFFHAIDPWVITPHYKYWTPEQMVANEARFDRIMATRPMKIMKYKMTSHEAVNLFQDGSIDLVFIDGDHEYDAVIQDMHSDKGFNFHNDHERAVPKNIYKDNYFKSFEKLKATLPKGIKVLNATPGSALPTFPLVNLEDYL